MMARSDNYSFRQDDKQFLRYLIRLRQRASKAMFMCEEAIQTPGQPNVSASGELEELKLFKRTLNQLLVDYYWRFEKRKDVDRPNALQESVESGIPRVDDLNFTECRKVFYRIAELQEKLGHTSIESKEREETGVGGKN